MNFLGHGRSEGAIAAAEAVLGLPLADHCIDCYTGEVVLLVIVSGSCHRSALFEGFIRADPSLPPSGPGTARPRPMG